MSTVAAPLDPGSIGGECRPPMGLYPSCWLRSVQSPAVWSGWRRGRVPRRSSRSAAQRSMARSGRAAESAALTMGTMPLFQEAGRRSGVDPGELRRHTKIAVKPNTQIISITVTAKTSEQAVREATAMAASRNLAGLGRRSRQAESGHRGGPKADSGADTDQHPCRAGAAGPARHGPGHPTGRSAGRRPTADAAPGGRAGPAGAGDSDPGRDGWPVGMLLGLGVAELLGVRRGTVQSGRELSSSTRRLR